VAENLARKLADLQGVSESARSNASALRSQIEQQLTDAGVESPDVSLRDDNSIVINLESNALFNSGRARLNPAGRRLVGQVAGVLNTIGNSVIVEGHTDSIPVSGDLTAIFPSNWELSVARAANTVNFLQSRGSVDPARLSALGFGEHRPVAPNNTREGRALNRRVEIVVKP